MNVYIVTVIKVRILFRHEATGSVDNEVYNSFHLHMGHRRDDKHLYAPYARSIGTILRWKSPLLVCQDFTRFLFLKEF